MRSESVRVDVPETVSVGFAPLAPIPFVRGEIPCFQMFPMCAPQDIEFRRGIPRDLHRLLGSGMLAADIAKVTGVLGG